MFFVLMGILTISDVAVFLIMNHASKQEETGPQIAGLVSSLGITVCDLVLLGQAIEMNLI